jgi:hypothetical protein
MIYLQSTANSGRVWFSDATVSLGLYRALNGGA